MFHNGQKSILRTSILNALHCQNMPNKLSKHNLSSTFDNFNTTECISTPNDLEMCLNGLKRSIDGVHRPSNYWVWAYKNTWTFMTPVWVVDGSRVISSAKHKVGRDAQDRNTLSTLSHGKMDSSKQAIFKAQIRTIRGNFSYKWFKYCSAIWTSRNTQHLCCIRNTR